MYLEVAFQIWVRLLKYCQIRKQTCVAFFCQSFKQFHFAFESCNFVLCATIDDLLAKLNLGNSFRRKKSPN